MSTIREIRRAGEAYSLEVRLEARGHYMRGLTYRQISEQMERDDRARAEAAGRDPGEVRPVPPAVIHDWARKNSWEVHRDRLSRQAERQQLERIRKEVSSELAKNGRTIGFLDSFVQQYFMVQKVDSGGKPIFDGAGKPVMVMRTPSSWPIDDPAKVVQLLLSVVDRRAAFLKQATDMLGDGLPKANPDTLVVSTNLR